MYEDIVLQDFCEVVGHYNNTSSPTHERVYFRKVMPAGSEPIPSTEVCRQGFVDLPWESRASECVVLKRDDDSSGSLTIQFSQKLAAVLLLIVGTVLML